MYMKISVEGEAFSGENKQYEVARILDTAAEQLESGQQIFVLRDNNGNHVGDFDLAGDEPDGRPNGSAVVVTFGTGNAAFHDGGVEWEAARIIRAAGDKVRDDGEFDFKVRDLNGNVVGACAEYHLVAEPESRVRSEDGVNDPTP